MGSAPARLRPVIQLAVDAGWTYSESSKGHPQLIPPPGLLDPYRQNKPAAPITFTKTPSEPRADVNAYVILRRLGVPIPRKGNTAKKKDRPQ